MFVVPRFWSRDKSVNLAYSVSCRTVSHLPIHFSMWVYLAVTDPNMCQDLWARRGTLVTKSRYFLTRLVFSLALFISASKVLAQENATFNPSCISYVRQSKLISPGVGWAILAQPMDHPTNDGDCTNDRLYWTNNDGKNWREITPAPMPTLSMRNVFFLDRSHGWILSTDALSEVSGAPFYLLSTKDGGKNWQTLQLQRPMFNMNDDYTFPTQLFFIDSLHGWMLWHWAIMNSQLNYLLETVDGGRTWKRLPDPPGPGPLQFTSPREGWMIGGLENPDGIPDYEMENLWVTHNGGVHWDAVSVPVPKELQAGDAFLVSLRFKNSREGFAVAEQQLSGCVIRFFTCFTRDGGRSWRFSQFDAYHANPSFVDNHIVWSVSNWPAMEVTIQNEDHVISPVLPSSVSGRPRLGDIYFVDDQNGWTSSIDLFSTTDGGKTFSFITPPVARKQ